MRATMSANTAADQISSGNANTAKVPLSGAAARADGDLVISVPPLGERIGYYLHEGQSLFFEAPLGSFQAEKQGTALQLTFDGGGVAVLENFYQVFSAANLPDVNINGQEMSGNIFFAFLGLSTLPEGEAKELEDILGGGGDYSVAHINLLDGVDHLGGLHATFDTTRTRIVDLRLFDAGRDEDSHLVALPNNPIGAELYIRDQEELPQLVKTWSDIPVALTDIAAIQETEATVSGNVLDNDISGRDGWADEAVTPGVFMGKYGALALASDGSYIYKLNEGVNAPHDASLNDIFTYTVHDGNGDSAIGNLVISIHDVNDVPVATNDAAAILETGESPQTESAIPMALQGNVLVNDSAGRDGWADEAVITTGSFTGEYGTLLLAADGSYTYTLNEGVNAPGSETLTDVFSYTVSDSDGDKDSANLVISIHDVNDVPVAVDDSASIMETGELFRLSPMRSFSARSVPERSVSGNVLDNDASGRDGWADEAVITTGSFTGEYGTLLLAADGSYTYTLNEDVNAPHEGALTDSFNYSVNDADGDSATGKLVVTVHDVNDMPRALDDAVSMNETESSVNGNVLTNDSSGRDGWAAKPVVNAGEYEGEYGVLDLKSDGSYTYTLNEDVNAPHEGTLTDSFNYSVNDVDGDSATGKLVVTVHDVNDMPKALDDVATVLEGEKTTGDLLANDSFGRDGRHETKFVLADSHDGTYGELIIHNDGSYEYIANSNIEGLNAGDTRTDTFSYTIYDGNNDTSSANLNIPINVVREQWVQAEEDRRSRREGEAGTGKLMAKDSDCHGLAFVKEGVEDSSIYQLNYGKLTVYADGTYSYTSNVPLEAGKEVQDMYTYTAKNEHGTTDTAQLILSVTGTDVSLYETPHWVIQDAGEGANTIYGEDVYWQVDPDACRPNPDITTHNIDQSVSFDNGEGIDFESETFLNSEYTASQTGNNVLHILGDVSNVKINMGAGEDYLSIGQASGDTFGNGSIEQSTILLGDGSDIMNVFGSVDKKTSIDLGNGDDVAFIQSMLDGTILCGDGNDYVTLDNFQVNKGSSVLVDGGEGHDILSFGSGDDHIQIKGDIITSLAASKVKPDSVYGQNLPQASDSNSGSITAIGFEEYSAGDGNDMIVLNSNCNVAIHGGRGNDYLAEGTNIDGSWNSTFKWDMTDIDTDYSNGITTYTDIVTGICSRLGGSTYETGADIIDISALTSAGYTAVVRNCSANKPGAGGVQDGSAFITISDAQANVVQNIYTDCVMGKDDIVGSGQNTTFTTVDTIDWDAAAKAMGW